MVFPRVRRPGTGAARRYAGTVSTALVTYGSFALAALGLLAAWFNARRRTRATGAVLQVVCCALVVPYNVLTGQYGFVISAVLFLAVYVRALRAIRREAREDAAATETATETASAAPAASR